MSELDFGKASRLRNFAPASVRKSLKKGLGEEGDLIDRPET